MDCGGFFWLCGGKTMDIVSCVFEELFLCKLLGLFCFVGFELIVVKN